MNASEIRLITEKAKESNLNKRRSDLLIRIEDNAKTGSDSLILNEYLNVEDVAFFEHLGYSIIHHSSPMYTIQHSNGTMYNPPTTNYVYSEISWK